MSRQLKEELENKTKQVFKISIKHKINQVII